MAQLVYGDFSVLLTGDAGLPSEAALLLLTHADADHIAAQVRVPARFRVAHALDTAVSQANLDAQVWRNSVARTGALVHVQGTGGWVDLGDDVALWTLWPPPGGFDHEHADNENSLVAKLAFTRDLVYNLV